ncbi:hypothetical protein [Deinococcus radiotolerans]|uniref:Uncharacterized protein n=1 Tax=Deinococcus radiotolerans TaxID=1309407 RepID=A0ABQ2FQ21_9DEIO|nr:hypothetical protein [Deinococcus radiotolerans]GGL15674.1 hypothetical protein GCM10010844_38260 [Deinococcus radiotolerans]
MRDLTLTGAHGGTLTVRRAGTRTRILISGTGAGNTTLDDYTHEQIRQLRDVLSEWLAQQGRGDQ